MISKGLPIVISAPSAGGKSTLADHVLKEIPSTVRSISCTTRAPRGDEKHGRDYFFIDQAEFKSKIENKGFLEWALVHGNYYGTPLAEFDKQLGQGRDVILTIDPQGAVAIRQIFPAGVFIFVVPPTWDSLVDRLNKRATETVEEKQKRIENGKKELSYLSHYDYLVVNDELEVAVSDVVAIIRAEHRRVNRVDQKDIPIFNQG